MRLLKPILAVLTALIMFVSVSQAQIQERSVKAVETLETGVSFVYQGSDIPVLDITYNEWSADSITWRKNYVNGDCYIRFSNDVKSTWAAYNICTGGGAGTSQIDTIFWTVDGVTDTITSGSASIYITNPDTVSGSSTNFQDTETHTHELFIELNDNEDVNASPANGQVIKWNSVSEKWEASNDLIAGGASGYLTVGEQDGSPSVTNVNEILVTNGTVIDNGAGSVSIDMLLQPVDGAQDFFRTDTVRVGEGDPFITFSTPFPTNDYILDAMYAIYDDGTRQNLVSDSSAVDGFRVLSILEDSATVSYLAMRNLDSLGLAVSDQGRVLASGSDPVLGYLNSKTDDSTITVTNNELTVLGAPSITSPLDSLPFSTDIAGLAWNEGMFYFDSIKQSHVGYIEELDVTFEFMYEEWIRVYNNSGVLIDNGDVAYLSGVVVDANNTVTVAPAQADSATTCLSTLGIATHSIENGTYGILTREGTVRDVNSTAMGFTASGELGYLSAINAGKIVATSPSSPNYSIKLGNVGKVHASTGTFEVGVDIGGNTGSVIKIFNGATLENTTVDVSSNGTTITATIEASGGGDLSLFFNGLFQVFDATPAASVNLVAGTDTVPVRNWVYIPLSTLTLTANQSGFPTNEQYVPVADVMCPSALGAFNNGLDKVHAWTDHLANSVGQGHMADINLWIRNQHATFLSGVVLTTDPLEDIFAANMDVSLSSGNILQLHPHTFAALSTTTSDSIKVINDPTFTNRPIGSLNSTDLSADSEGGSLNNKYYSVVLWGVVSEDAEDCQMFLTLPSGGYTNAANALLDAQEYTNKSIPVEYIGVGFLVNRLTLQNSGGNIKIVADGIENLRRTIPGISGAGGTGGGGATNYDELSDTPASKVGSSNKIVGVNTGETAHEYKDVTIDGSGNMTVTGWTLTDSLSVTNGAIMGGDLELNSDLIDVNNSVGTVGQVLSSLGVGSGTDWIDVAGTGDMTKAVYDPTIVNGDAFDMDNMVEGTTSKIMTATERTNFTAGYNDKINSLAFSGTTTKTLTLTQQDAGTVSNTFTDLVDDADADLTNEGSLTVAAGTGTTSIINSNTSGQTGVTLTAAGINTIGEVGNVITITGTEVDGVIGNEYQDLGFTVGTGEITISDGSNVTVGSFGIVNTNYGFVVGSNSVGASYFLSADGTWSIPAGGGNVSNTGTPLDNQLAVWTNATTIEGTSGLTYDGSNFQLTGDIGATGSRITKGWFTDLEVTNSIAGSITGSAPTLTTARDIYGNSFDGSAALTQVIASTYGGTGNGFTKFTGATTAEKTYTLPDATTTILTTNAAVSETQGGTGQTTYTTGDILYASGSNTLSKLAAGTDTYVLTMGASVPAWAAPSSSTPTRQVLTSGTSITFDGDNGTWASLTLAHNATLTFNDFSDFTKGQITVTQDGTGSRTLAFAETITAVTSIEYDGGFELINPDASTTSVVKYTIDDTVLRISIKWYE